MHHEFSAAIGPSDIPGLALHTVWFVDADDSYDVSRSKSASDSSRIRRMGGTGGIAIFTVGGAGRIYLSGPIVVEATPFTLVLTNFRQIRRYHTKGCSWRFWWFEYSAMTPWQAPSDHAIEVGNDQENNNLIDQLYADIRSERVELRRRATAAFALLLCRWMAAWQGVYNIRQSEQAIYRVIAMIHQDIYRPWRVSELAAAASMSPRGFSAAFAKATGLSPKQFLTRLRLDMSAEYLRLGVDNVSEVAVRFGFSSPYHFSNAFYKHFGYRPSQDKP